MNIAICDDAADERHRLLQCLESFSVSNSLDYKCDQYSSALDLLKNGKLYDLIFMDIFMDRLNGMQAAKLLRKARYSGDFVFTTTSADYAVESYEVEALGYLCKPFSQSSFAQVMDRVCRKHSQSLKCITLRVEWGEVEVFVKDIVFVETGGNHTVIVHTLQRDIKSKILISKLETELVENGDFLRSHRGYLVNLRHVVRADSDCIEMSDGSRALLTVREAAKIRQQIADYIWRKARE